MDDRSTIFINGRFLTRHVTGIQRYCREVLHALDLEIQSREELRIFKWILLTPAQAVAPELTSIEVEELPGRRGNLWEQITLYRRTRKATLLSFGSTGPILHRHQLITVHDAAVYRVPDSLNWRFKLWYKFMVGWIVRRNRSIFAVSEFSKSECIQCFKARPENVCVTLEGWQHLDRIEESDRAEIAEMVGDKPYVLAVSSPTPNKNFQLVVAAMQQMGETPFEFVVAGSLDPRLFVGSGNVPTNAKYLGYVTDSQLKGLYRDALCFVFPSRYEGFGLPPLEAMSMGCPVLVSDIGAVREVCGDVAMYFNPADAEQLAKQLSAMTSTPESTRLWGEKGLARAQEFSWQRAASRVANHLLKHYRPI